MELSSRMGGGHFLLKKIAKKRLFNPIQHERGVGGHSEPAHSTSRGTP